MTNKEKIMKAASVEGSLATPVWEVKDGKVQVVWWYYTQDSKGKCCGSFSFPQELLQNDAWIEDKLVVVKMIATTAAQTSANMAAMAAKKDEEQERK